MKALEQHPTLIRVAIQETNYPAAAPSEETEDPRSRLSARHLQLQHCWRPIAAAHRHDDASFSRSNFTFRSELPLMEQLANDYRQPGQPFAGLVAARLENLESASRNDEPRIFTHANSPPRSDPATQRPASTVRTLLPASPGRRPAPGSGRRSDRSTKLHLRVAAGANTPEAGAIRSRPCWRTRPGSSAPAQQCCRPHRHGERHQPETSRLHTLTPSRTPASSFSPMPGTASRSSTEANLPFSSRQAMIRSASAGPMRGNVSSAA